VENENISFLKDFGWSGSQRSGSEQRQALRLTGRKNHVAPYIGANRQKSKEAGGMDDFAGLIASGASDDDSFAAIRAAEKTGRPLGTADFVADLERRLGRPIARRAPGRKPTHVTEAQVKLL
jgi:hypothetical protein